MEDGVSPLPRSLPSPPCSTSLIPTKRVCSVAFATEYEEHLPPPKRLLCSPKRKQPMSAKKSPSPSPSPSTPSTATAPPDGIPADAVFVRRRLYFIDPSPPSSPDPSPPASPGLTFRPRVGTPPATTTLPPAGQAIWDALMARVMSTDFSAAAQGIDPEEGAAAALLAPDPEPQDPEVDALSSLLDGGLHSDDHRDVAQNTGDEDNNS
ncbi:unnamed protein product [Umbelopsis vinacea]